MKRRSFVVRVWIDDDGQFWGQISDPFSDWRQPFQGVDDLWKQIQQLLADMPESSAVTIDDSPMEE